MSFHCYKSVYNLNKKKKIWAYINIKIFFRSDNENKIIITKVFFAPLFFASA